MMEMVRLKPNVPQQLALAETDPQLDERDWGDFYIYHLTDGRFLSVNSEVAASINILDLDPGEPFCICKRWSGKRREKSYWDVWRAGEPERSRAKGESELESKLRQSIDLAKQRGPVTPMPPKPPTNPPDPSPLPPAARSNVRTLKQPDSRQMKLPWEESLQTESRILTDTFASTLAYSSAKHGNAVKPEDVRSLVITAYISKRGRGGFNAA